jgi:hypothetical protein
MLFDAGVRPVCRRHFIYAAEVCFAMVMRLIPRRYRFRAAFFIARGAVPLFRMTDAYRVQEMIGFDDPDEIALHFILNALTRNGTLFDPVVTVNGYEKFEQAYRNGRGVLVIGPHAALTLLMIRPFYDQGLDPVIVSPDPRMRISGTLVTARTVQPSPTFLVKTRSKLRRGELICAMPDRAEHHGNRTVEFATSRGHVIVAPALMQVAARCGAEVVFTEIHAEECGLVGTIAVSSAGTADAITKEFMGFVRAFTESRSRRHG